MYMLLLASQQSPPTLFRVTVHNKKIRGRKNWRARDSVSKTVPSVTPSNETCLCCFSENVHSYHLCFVMYRHDSKQTEHTNPALHTTSAVHRPVRSGSWPPCVAEWHQYHFLLLLSELLWPPAAYTWGWEVLLCIYFMAVGLCLLLKGLAGGAWEECVIHYQQGLASTVHLCDTYRKCLKGGCCFM